jgi:transposase, IS30 family
MPAHALAYAGVAGRRREAGHEPGAAWQGGGRPGKKYSPEQIAGRLKVDFPDQREMQVSTETIYQSLYVQSRGALKRDLTSLWLGVNQDGPGRADLSDRRRLLQEVEVSV